jgi:phosphatidylglycerophosphate synthase
MLTVPNFLTLLRIMPSVFLILLADGNYGRRSCCRRRGDRYGGRRGGRLTNSRSELGAVLDPMADSCCC